MTRDIFVETERFPIAGSFTISRGSKTEAEVLTCTIRRRPARPRRMRALSPLRRDDGQRCRRRSRRCAARSPPASAAKPCSTSCPPGRPATPSTARCGTSRRRSAATAWHQTVCSAPPGPLTTAYTLSLGEPGGDGRAGPRQGRAAAAQGQGRRRRRRCARIRAVAASRADGRIILDANEGWTDRQARGQPGRGRPRSASRWSSSRCRPATTRLLGRHRAAGAGLRRRKRPQRRATSTGWPAATTPSTSSSTRRAG